MDYKPLKIPQKYWSRKQTWKSVPASMLLFLLSHGLYAWTGTASDDLMVYKKKKDQEKKCRERENPLVSDLPASTRKELYSEEQFKDKKRLDHVIPQLLIVRLSKKYGWHKEDAKTLPFLTILQFSRIPIYFFTLQLAPFALIPSLLPWK